MQMVVEDDGAEYIVTVALFGLAVKLKRCQFGVAQTLCAFDEHLVCIKTWKCVYFPSEPTKSC